MKIKYSRQREKILQVIQEAHTHPTADWIYARLKPEMPKLSLGTVYRNLNLLVQQGKIQSIPLGSITRYDMRTSPHYHFICEKCGELYDVEEPLPQEYLNKIQKKTHHKILRHSLEFFGICQKCQNLRSDS